MNCDELVSLEGTAAHNILFARPGTRLIVLEKYEIPNLRQFVLDECAKIHAVYVGAYPEVRFQSRDTEGPFLVGLTEEAKAFFTASGMKFDESSINLKQRRENEKHYVSEWRVKPWKQLVRKVTGRIAECGRRH